MIGSLRKVSNKLYKKSKIYKSIRWIVSLRFFHFTFRFLIASFFLDKLDSHNPYKGIISKNLGFYISSVSKNCVNTLKRNYYENYESQSKVSIDKTNISAFDEIFGIIKKPIIDYLGAGVKLDGIYYFVSKKKSKKDIYDNVSVNWHTDNVGARLKVFVCFEGDGTKPTLFIKPRNITKSLKDKIKIYFLEVIRWFGIDNNTPINSQIELRHKESSLIILDTQFLHRGALKKSVSQRSMIALEFSNPEKHRFFEKGISKGPIGTVASNEFYFSNELLDCKNIYQFFDQKRISKLGKISKYEKKF